MAKAKSKAVAQPTQDEERFVLPAWVKFGSQIREERVEWDWHGRILRSSLNLIDGDKGNGKSTVATSIAVALCSGRKLPGERKPGRKGRCLWIGSEERGSIHIKPRWIAQGGNPDDIVTIDCAACREEDAFIMPGDEETISRTCREIGARVVVVDPYSSLAAPSLSLVESRSARRLQESWLHVAHSADVTVIQLRHLTKDRTRSALNAGEGSPQVAAAARVLMRVDPIQDREKEWYLSTVITNWGSPVLPVEYKIRGEEGAAGTLTWGKVADVPLDQIMQGVGDAGEQDAGREADRFLRLMLKSGAVAYKELEEKGVESGLTRSMLRSAKVRCGIQQRFKRSGNKGKGHSEWFIPSEGKPAPSAPSAPSERA